MYDHSLRILEREGIEGYATVIGRSVSESYNIAIRELAGVPYMEQLRNNLIHDRDELEWADKLLRRARIKQVIGFAGVVLAIVLGLGLIVHTLKITGQFVERDLPRLVR